MSSAVIIRSGFGGLGNDIADKILQFTKAVVYKALWDHVHVHSSVHQEKLIIVI